MSDPTNVPARLLPRLVCASLGVAVGLGVIGFLPTVNIAGAAALTSMAAGIGISLLVSCIGALPVSFSAGGDPMRMPTVVMGATALRFVPALGLTAAAALSGLFNRNVLVMWVALSYLALLAVDTVYAVRLVGPKRRAQP